MSWEIVYGIGWILGPMFVLMCIVQVYFTVKDWRLIRENVRDLVEEREYMRKFEEEENEEDEYNR